MRVIVFTIILAGCASPLGKLDLKDGETGCLTINSLIYGKAAMSITRDDNVAKGQMSVGTRKINCGEATMDITTNVGPPVPVGATTSTTTVVTPAITPVR